MRIISEATLKRFWEDNPQAEMPMKQWISKTRDADWTNFSDLRQTFNSADIYKCCVIFNVGGNNFRIIGMIEYERHLVFIRAVLTHKEYDKNKWKPDCE